jgi:pyruvate dehydrogenase E2 component (dihydrolipoamide acetyltransferase)
MAREIILPNLGGDTEGTLIDWRKQPGDTIAPGDIIAEVETGKASMEVPAEVGGVILNWNAKPGDTITSGSVIGYAGEAGEAVPGSAAPAPVKANGGPPPQAAPAPTPVAAPPALAVEDGTFPDGVKASPIARKIAAERGIDLRRVPGTGPGGRVTKSDIEGFVAPAVAPHPPVTAAAAPAPALASAPTYGALPTGPDVEIIDVSRMRSTIARRMIQAKQQTPHFYVTSEIDTSALMALRAELNANLSEDAKITVNDLIIKAAALALVQFPNLNTHYYGDKLVRHKRIHIGIAVAVPNGGLINVVAKDADRQSIGTLAVLNKAMIARAREGKIQPDDVQGSTFTVSNLGAYDVEHFLAIINPPEAGILAVSSARKVPVVLADGSLGVGSRMKATVSVDHRVSDGAEGAQFMQAFRALIENPMRLLI